MEEEKTDDAGCLEDESLRGKIVNSEDDFVNALLVKNASLGRYF
jgi:hypothetical protein